jgi:two-component system, HptB-dependent secretion and biofilm response regulator
VDTPLRILVADDNQADLLLLSSMLRKEGHDVITAVDGLDALASFEKHSPQLVLLDALMPRMDGLEAARRIKASVEDAFIPIIFLTSLTAADELVRCLDAGGDDFLSKPYNGVILRAKIEAFERMRQLHVAVQAKRDEIRQHHTRLLKEQNAAKSIFDRVAHTGCLHSNNINHLISPMAIFNGDVLLAARAPAGNMHVFLGDFTGHGLPAAIGTMPLAELFYSMTARGFSMADILREANRKLCDILPTGFFCCAAMVNMNFHKRTVEIWNGGLPAVYLCRREGADGVEHIASMHLPLGLLAPGQFRTMPAVRELAASERVLMCTDGIVEARDCEGEMFGPERLAAILSRPGAENQSIAEIRQQLASHVSGQSHEDDYSLVEVTMVANDEVTVPVPLPHAVSARGPREWSLDYTLEAHSLAIFNPMPLLQRILMDVPDLRSRAGEIFAVLSELYSNALDHGVMRLESSAKHSPNGFDDYYRRRTAALAALESGWIRFRLRSRYLKGDGYLEVRVTDSGSGFDYERYTGVESDSDTLLHGRGLRVVAQLCDSLDFHGCGNDVEVCFRWAGTAAGPGSGIAA